MFRTLLTFASAAVVGGFVRPATAGPPAGIADVTLARAALAAVDADPLLKAAAVVVSVKDRVAVVGGPVPSAEAVRRAELVVRGVPGVAEVRNRCYVQSAADPLLRPVNDWPSPLPPRRLLADLPGVLPARPGQVGEAPPDRPDATVAPSPADRTRVALKPAPAGDNILLAPVAPGGGTVATPVPAVLTGRAGVAEAAEAARRADPRFAGLTVELMSGTVVIGGTAGRAADAWDLAQNLRAIPGVARVAVGSVGVK